MARNQKGLTLIEVVIVMAIAAILVLAGLPGLQTYLMDSKLTSQTNSWIAIVNYARSEAIMHGGDVYVTANTVNNDEWGGGWQIWREPTLPNGLLDDEDTELLKEISLKDGITITGPNGYANQNLSSLLAGDLKARTLVFRSNGAFLSTQSAKFSITDNRSNHTGPDAGMCIEIQRTGRLVMRDRDNPC